MNRERLLELMADIDTLCLNLHEFCVSEGVPVTADGFLKTALTGDEDEVTMACYRGVYNPLNVLTHMLRDTYQKLNTYDLAN